VRQSEKESLREAKPLFRKIFPFPLLRGSLPARSRFGEGRGIKGIGF